MGLRVTSVNVSTKVLLRDVISLVFCEFVLILLINGQRLYWWQGLVLIGLYVAYLTFMLMTMSRIEGARKDGGDNNDSEDCEAKDAVKPRSLFGSIFYWVSLGPLMDLERAFVREKHREQIENETWNGWPLLLASTSIIAVAC